ncbi:MAG: aminotransferase class V-fold PLP-dependent enzyme [Bacteroidia bacterium]|nr:aminotransferase class V-fold PLP-dependent enzyme [Bacteroidia bacterium]
MKNAKIYFSVLEEALSVLTASFSYLPGYTGSVSVESIRSVLLQAGEKMGDNYPYFHPLYAGQMLKPPHPVAQLAYMLSMYINPNNHALDGGKASSAMEKEAVAEIAGMFGWAEFLGHLTGGGTMANLEALWISGKERPGKCIAVSAMAHYTHERISEVLGLECCKVKATEKGQMDIPELEALLKKGNVGTVVVTMGTTGMGAVDPLAEIIALKKKYGFRIHCDAAYGGYFSLAETLHPETKRHFDCMSEADSIVIDPHKHGLQPYGCGCILFKNPDTGKWYKHDSPYTYFSSQELHLGEISLECSRPGASAVALWATQQVLPLIKGGEFARNLEKSLTAARELKSLLLESGRILFVAEPELDILVFAPKAAGTEEISRISRDIFHQTEKNHLYLALYNYPVEKLPAHWDGVEKNSKQVTCIRTCLMKPEHLEWVPEIGKRILGVNF